MRTPSWLVGAAAVLLTVTGIGIGGLAAPEPAAAASGNGAAFDCTGDYVYSIDNFSGGEHIYSVPTGGIGAGPVTATVVTDGLPAATARNAFAITPGGDKAYYIAAVGGRNGIYSYDPHAGTSTRVADSPIAPPQGGAYDPLNGFFYFGNTAVGSPLYAYDPARNVMIGQVGKLPANATSPSGGGDFAFDNAGDFFWTNGPTLYNLPATAVPSTAGTASLPNATKVSVSALNENQPGIAFDPQGHLYEVTPGGRYSEVNPITGETSAPSTGSRGTDLADMAGCNPPSSLTVRKDLSGRTFPNDQFAMTISATGGTPAVATTSGAATGLQTATVATVGVVNLTYRVSETAAGTTDLADYDSSYDCVDANDPADDLGLRGTGTSFEFAYPGGDDRRIVCTFTNTPRTATLQLSKSLDGARGDASDQFTVAVRADSATGTVLSPTGVATSTGAGAVVSAGTGTTGTTTVIASRTYHLTEQMAPGSASALPQYAARITCVDANGRQTGLPDDAPFAGSLAITPVPDAAISCELENAAIAPTLRLTKELGSARFAPGDQFTVGIRTGSADGPVVSDVAAATTAGSGATVTAGTGTTGVFAAEAGRTYHLTETASGNASRYRGWITCTDANGHQQDLPSAEPLRDSFAITPVAGAAISCTITNDLGPAALSLTKTGPERLVVGQPAAYRLTVTNDGGTASDLTEVADRLPANVQYEKVTTTDWVCRVVSGTVADGQYVTCSGPAIPAGSSSSFELQVRPMPDAAGTSVRNHATVDPTGGDRPAEPADCTADGTPAGCAVTPPAAVENGVELRLSKANPAELTVGVSADYGLTVSNVGTGPAASATVTDGLPAGIAFVSASGADCSASGSVASGQLVTCTISQQVAANGGSHSFTIRVNPTQAAAGQQVRNLAVVDVAGGTEPGDPADCTDAVESTPGCAATPELPVQAGIALTLHKQAPESMTVGVPAEYAFTVTNDGTGAAPSATVHDRLPAGVAFVSADGASCALQDGVLECLVTGPIAAQGGTAQFRVTVLPQPSSGEGTVVNAATVDPDGGADPSDPADCAEAEEPDPGCAVTPAVPVGNGVRLGLDKANPDNLTVGVATDYVLTITNNGTGPAASATVRDLLPEGLVYNSAAGADCTAVDRLVTCTVTGPFAADGGTGFFTINVTPLPGADGAALVNRAAVDVSGGAEPVDPGTCDRTGAPAGCAITAALSVGTARLHLVKTADPIAPATVPVALGDGIRYTFTITNASDVRVEGVRVQDPKVERVTCPATELAPGASVDCVSEPYAVTQADLDSGRAENSATASARLVGCAADCVVAAPASTARTATRSVGAVSLVKRADVARVTQVGEIVTYTFTIANTGTVTVTGAHPEEGAFTGTGELAEIACPAQADRLAPGESVQCTASYAVTAADLERGELSNTAVAAAESAIGAPAASDPSTAGVLVDPPAPLPSTGGAISWGVIAIGLLLLAGGGLVVLAVARRGREQE